MKVIPEEDPEGDEENVFLDLDSETEAEELNHSFTEPLYKSNHLPKNGKLNRRKLHRSKGYDEHDIFPYSLETRLP